MAHGHLSVSEREMIAWLLAAGVSQAQIGRLLARAASTISRELKRNGNSSGFYSPSRAQGRYEQRRRAANRSRPRLLEDGRLQSYVLKRVQRKWSPEQISGRLELDYLLDERMSVSHETIYAWIAQDKWRGGELWKSLPQGQKRRRRRYGGRDNRGRIVGRVGIEQRPEIVETRMRLGDWEGDTVAGRGNRGHLVTQVERRSRYLVAARVPDRKAATVNAGIARSIRRIPRRHRHTLTLDNGQEFARHKELRKLGLTVYFADPYSAWQRGANENTNGLLRRFFPKKTDFSQVSDAELAEAVRLLNNRPRKCLSYRTPHEVLINNYPIP